jgi:hypothetical protein
MAEPIFTKLGMYMMVPEPISVTCFINLSYQSLCLYVYPLIFARRRLGKNVTAATNTHLIEIFLDASVYMLSLPYQGKYGINSSQDFLLIVILF